MKWSEGLESKSCYRTYDALNELAAETGCMEEFCEAVFGAWISIIRGHVLERATIDRSFLSAMHRGVQRIYLLRDLTPSAFRQGVANLIATTIGDSPEHVSRVTGLLGRKLGALAHEKKYFEPLGMLSESGLVIAVTLWEDFLNPIIDGPPEFITG